jgi:hypothetical protein
VWFCGGEVVVVGVGMSCFDVTWNQPPHTTSSVQFYPKRYSDSGVKDTRSSIRVYWMYEVARGTSSSTTVAQTSE